MIRVRMGVFFLYDDRLKIRLSPWFCHGAVAPSSGASGMCCFAEVVGAKDTSAPGRCISGCGSIGASPATPPSTQVITHVTVVIVVTTRLMIRRMIVAYLIAARLKTPAY